MSFISVHRTLFLWRLYSVFPDSPSITSVLHYRIPYCRTLQKSYNGELPRHSFANYNLTLWHFFNYLIFLGPVLLFDSGYAIMFIFFVLLRTIFLFRDYQWACIEANEVPIYGNFYRKLLEKQVILEERIKELSDSGDTNEKDRLQKTLKDIKRQRLVKFNIIYIIIGVVFVLACILAPHILTMTYLGAILFTVLITGIIYFGSTPAVRFRT